MDFKRIQLLLLIFFLVFDIYLFQMLLARSEVNSQVTTQIETTIEEDLSARNIRYEELSKETTTLPLVKANSSDLLVENLSQLEGQNASINDRGELISTFNEAIPLNIGLNRTTETLNEDQIEQLRANFLSQPSYFIEGTAYDSFRYLPDERIISIRMNAYEGRIIADGSAELRLILDENYNLIQYIQTYQDHIQPLSTERNIISERMALEIINQRADTTIPDNSTITRMRQCYYRSSNLEDFDIYSPAWGIIYRSEDGQSGTVYIDATRGTLIEHRKMDLNI